VNGFGGEERTAATGTLGQLLKPCFADRWRRTEKVSVFIGLQYSTNLFGPITRLFIEPFEQFSRSQKVGPLGRWSKTSRSRFSLPAEVRYLGK
jgi:hypothetical protein